MPDYISAIPPSSPPVITAEQALIIYKISQPRGSYFHAADKALVMDHEVHHHNGQVIIGAGTLLSAPSVDRMVALMQDGAERSDWFLPPNVLVSSPRRLVWWVKGAVRPMHFSHHGRHQKLMVAWPSLVFSVNERRLKIAALRGSRRPRPGTRLFHAPVMNTSGDGSVCTGSAETPTSWTVDTCHDWESVIFDTNFSHTNQSQTLNVGKPGKGVGDAAHRAFWRRLARDKATVFPVDALVPLSSTLKQWI